MALSVESQGQLSLRAVTSDFGVLRPTREQRTWEVIDTLRRSPRTGQCRSHRLALAWVAGRPAVSSVILGARTLQQLTDNLGASALVLTDSSLTRRTNG